MSKSKRISPQDETKIVAMIARGDTYDSIREKLAEEGTSVCKASIFQIKKRNAESLALIRNKVIEVEASKTVDILMKSRNLIEKKLDESESTKVPVYLQKLYDDGKIDDAEFDKRYANVLAQRQLGIKDLTTVSKEMFNQSQIESGRPTSITNSSPEIAKERLQTLMTAINSGKEEDIVKAIFIDA